MNDKQMTIINQFWKEGENAFISGLPENSNPYPPNNRVARSSWRCGWICARGGIFYSENYEQQKTA